MTNDKPMGKVLVRLKGGSYPVIIGSGIFPRLGKTVRRYLPGERLCLVSDERVARYWLAPARDALEKEGYEVFPYQVPEGEESKSMDNVIALYDFLIQAKMDRSSPLLALGGGVVGDLTGFVAATYLRGVPYGQVPTSLVAQVDASVGGKTGVNHKLGKNLVGAFYQPRLVFTDVKLLTTLPRRDFLAGLAEVVKYGVIQDASLFTYLEERLADLLSYEDEPLLHVVERCCQIKAEIVAQDEKEEGIRAILNFGHTLGHALETLTAYQKYRHGEAIAIGMVFAANLSCRQGLLSPQEVGRLKALLKRVGLPTELPDFPAEDYMNVVGRDKKGRGSSITFVFAGPLGSSLLRPIKISEIFRDWLSRA